MARQKLDGVVEAVHLAPDGQLQWARAYLRRGPTFSDRVILDRQALVAQLKAGKKFFVGERVLQMGSTFQVSSPIRLLEVEGKAVLVSGDQQASQDRLEGIPAV